MITHGADVEMHALAKQGWSLSAIARHVGHDRKTVRAYLNGEREVGVRAKQQRVVDPFDRFDAYVRQRFVDDPHVWATVLFDDVVALGFERSYQRFTHCVRERGLRPHCEACEGVQGRATVEIEHPAGVELQCDWLELHDTPWGSPVFLLVGSLSHSSRFRGWFAESMDQPHLVEGVHEALVGHGGTAKRWRVDRAVLPPQQREFLALTRGQSLAMPSSTSAWRTEARTAVSVKSRSRATLATEAPGWRTSSTTSALNSLVNDRRRRPFFPTSRS